MRKVIVAVAAIGATVAMIGYTSCERERIALDASGEWWCDGEYCNTASCEVGRCVARPRAACVSARLILRDKEIRQCWSTLADCDELRERLLKDRDVDGVGACRVVSATAEDREAYKRHVIYSWIASGALVVLVGLILLTKGANALAVWAIRRGPHGSDDEWRRKLRTLK